MQFKNFDVDAFLAESWQKRPLLIRNPWGTSWRNPLEPDALAGLACEEGVEARLIVDKRRGKKVRHGPFKRSRFAKLGKRPWTLLVQAVDHVVPEVAALIAPFRFVPNWRIDDVMVSYATDGGGVGPHFDRYDVFLVQGMGQRRWQVGPPCDAQSPMVPHDDLRLLAKFEPTEEWLLDPGDMLYVPPGVAHNGVAFGDDCMTYSVGFRAPSRSELVAHWCDHLLAGMTDDDRYADPGLQLQENPGEISADALDELHAMMTDKVGDRAAFARWFGEYTTTPKYSDGDDRLRMSEAGAEMRLTEGVVLRRNAASRFSFIRQDRSGLLLFADGQSFTCEGETAVVAERICAQDTLRIGEDGIRSDAAMALIAALLEQGSLIA